MPAETKKEQSGPLVMAPADPTTSFKTVLALLAIAAAMFLALMFGYEMERLVADVSGTTWNSMVVRTIIGAGGGAILAVALKWLRPGMSNARLSLVALGWGISWWLGWRMIYSPIGWEGGWLLSWLMSGGVTVAGLQWRQERFPRSGST